MNNFFYGSSCLIGNRYKKIIQNLESYGISCISFPDNNSIEYPIAAHTDMSFLSLNRNNLLCSSVYRGSLTEKKLLELDIKVDYFEHAYSKYPFDAAFNICAVGDKLIYSPDSHNKIISCFPDLFKEYKMIPCRQGYSKCSTLIVSDNAIITSDVGIYNSAMNAEMDVLLIDQGHISLPGYKYGFIGGASINLSPDVIAFTGNIGLHPDYERISSYLNNYNIQLISLSSEPLLDIGGAIMINPT